MIGEDVVWLRLLFVEYIGGGGGDWLEAGSDRRVRCYHGRHDVKCMRREEENIIIQPAV